MTVAEDASVVSIAVEDVVSVEEGDSLETVSVKEARETDEVEAKVLELKVN